MLLLEDDDVEGSFEAAGLTEEVIRKERAGRATAHDGDSVAILKHR